MDFKRKYEKVTLTLTTKEFEEGWNSARQSMLSLQELFPDEVDEYEVKAKALELFNQNIPIADINERIQNSFWNLTIQSNKFYFRTNKLIFGYNVDIELGEHAVVVDKTYTFMVTLLVGKEDYARKLLLNNGWTEISPKNSRLKDNTEEEESEEETETNENTFENDVEETIEE